MSNLENRNVEMRLLKIAALLVGIGSLLTWFLYDLLHALSFLGGGLLAGLGMLWLRAVLNATFLQDRKASKRRVLAGFLLRLLLIPLCLYAMIRFLFLSIPAAVAGFAVVHCSIFVEAILEAFSGSTDHARAK